MWSIVKLLVLLVAMQALAVNGYNSCPYGGHMIAVSSWRITIFNQTLDKAYDSRYISGKEGMECSWQIESKKSFTRIRLTFDSFHLKNSSHTSTGDCVYIYDGKDASADQIQALCDRMPERVYNSSGKFLTVVFKQGDLGGKRWMTLNYTAQASTKGVQNNFWSTTVGRVLSVIGFIIIFAFFSYLFKLCRSDHGNSSNCRTLQGICHSLSRCLSRCPHHCQRHAQDICQQCHSLCWWKNTGGPSSPHRSQRQSSEGEAQSINTDIATISESGERLSVPSFTESMSEYGSGAQRSGQRQNADSLSSTSYEVDLQAPPPDYFSVLFPSRDVLSDSSQGGERTPVDPPDYSSTLSLSGVSNPPPPPPSDNGAPPSYELPDPPSYDSLFDNNTCNTNA